MKNVIDFHTHPIVEKKHNMNFYNMELSPDDFISDLKNAGINIFCGSILENRVGCVNIWELNQKARELRSIYGDTCIPGIHVHPDFIKKSIEEVECAAKEGIRLVGELVPYVHGWEDYSCKDFSEILDVIENYNMVVSLHTMDLSQMKKMALEHKKITFVFAHPGERVQIDKHIEVMKECDNVQLDTSGTGIFRYGSIKYLVDKVGAERIIFGTDYPVCNPKMYLNAVLGEKITDRQKEMILGDNAKRILRL